MNTASALANTAHPEGFTPASRQALPEVFSRSEARAAGYTDEAIRWRLTTQAWVRLRRGWYTTSTRWDRANTNAGSLTLLHARAVQLSAHGMVLSHRSAALAHGLSLLHPPPDRLHLTGPRSGRSGIAHIVHHAPRRALSPHDITTVEEAAVTTIGRTLRDIALTSSRHEAVVLADEILRRGLLTRQQLNLALATGGSRTAAIARDADGASTDMLTSVARLVLQGAVPSPHLGVRLRGAATGTGEQWVSMLWPDSTVAAFPHDAIEAIAVARRVGLHVEPYQWSDVLDDPIGFRQRIAHALAYRSAFAARAA